MESTITLLQADEAIRPFSEHPWRIQSFIGGISILYSVTGAKKTFVACSMVASVAGGRPWFGHRVRQGAVLYVVGEGGAESVARRMRAAAMDLNLRLSELPVYLVPRALNLNKGSADYEALVGAVEREDGPGPPGLFVVDTLSRCMPGDENKQEVAQAFIAGMDELRARWGCDILLLHHRSDKSKSVKGMRGSSVFSGAADTVMHLRKPVGRPSLDEAERLEVVIEKTREFGDTSAVQIGVYDVPAVTETGEVEYDSFGKDLSVAVLRRMHYRDEDARDALQAFRALAENPEDRVSYGDWLAATGWEETRFRIAVAAVMADWEKNWIVRDARDGYVHKDPSSVMVVTEEERDE